MEMEDIRMNMATIKDPTIPTMGDIMEINDSGSFPSRKIIFFFVISKLRDVLFFLENNFFLVISKLNV